MANIFALPDSALNPFLFSDVGVEANGTGLTILSLLARLGKDPWAEAAAWSLKPRDAAAKSLTDSISQMPPNPQAFHDAHLTAARLVALLPTQNLAKVVAIAPRGLGAYSKAAVLIVTYFALFFALNLWFTVPPRADVATGPVTHMMAPAAK